MITVNKLSKSYGKNLILNDINVQLLKGKIYGIVGVNGSGKTTFFECIAGLEKHEGEVICNSGSLKDVLGLLRTNPYLLSKITGKEYLQLLCNARKIKVHDFEKHNIFDLPLNKFAENYSTGMKKKLAFTAVLMQKNEVFILDEPFNGLDLESNLILTAIIKKLKSLNKTILISSHIFESLKNLCDTIFYLKDGHFGKTFNANEFDALESEMKELNIENRIEAFDLF